MEIKQSLLPTSVTYSGEFLSSDAKIPTLFDINEVSDENVSGESKNTEDGVLHRTDDVRENGVLGKDNVPLEERMENRVLDLAQRLHLDNVEVVRDASGLEGRKKRAKGFYDTKTGKITIVIGNHGSVADVERTLLHEAVAHYGLRQLLGKGFDTFLDYVYRSMICELHTRAVDATRIKHVNKKNQC